MSAHTHMLLFVIHFSLSLPLSLCECFHTRTRQLSGLDVVGVLSIYIKFGIFGFESAAERYTFRIVNSMRVGWAV